MKNNFGLLKSQDPIVTGSIIILSIISLILVFSTTYNPTDEFQESLLFPKQIFFILGGFLIYGIVMIFDFEWLKHLKVLSIVYIVLLLGLIYLLLLGPNIAETRRWIRIGFISIQLSEYAKILIILSSAFFYSQFDIRRFSFAKHIPNDYILFILNYISLLPILVLVFLQPSFGNTFILFLIVTLITVFRMYKQLDVIWGITIISIISQVIYKPIELNSNFSIILYIFLPIAIIISLFFIKNNLITLQALFVSILLSVILFPALNFGWNQVLKDYQRDRVVSFVEGAEEDPFGSGYQVTQAKIAFASGGPIGRGFLQGTQTSLRVLDFAYTDFIFASLGEQFGFVGASILLLIYIILLLRLLVMLNQVQENYSKLIIIGVFIMLLLNIFINVGMNIGILPVTGVPLPLVSYGGNSIIVNMIGLGLVQAVYIKENQNQENQNIIRQNLTDVYSLGNIYSKGIDIKLK